MKKNLGYLTNRVRGVNTDVKEHITNAFTRSLLFYFATPMIAAGLWDTQTVAKIEGTMYRKTHCIPNDVRTADVYNVTSHLRDAAKDIKIRADKINKDISR